MQLKQLKSSGLQGVNLSIRIKSCDCRLLLFLGVAKVLPSISKALTLAIDICQATSCTPGTDQIGQLLDPHSAQSTDQGWNNFSMADARTSSYFKKWVKQQTTPVNKLLHNTSCQLSSCMSNLARAQCSHSKLLTEFKKGSEAAGYS